MFFPLELFLSFQLLKVSCVHLNADSPFITRSQTHKIRLPARGFIIMTLGYFFKITLQRLHVLFKNVNASFSFQNTEAILTLVVVKITGFWGVFFFLCEGSLP